MRRLLLITVTLTAVMFSISDSQAFDVKGKWTISPSGGISFPVGDFADDDKNNAHAGGANTGYNLGIAVEYRFTDQMLVGVRSGYDRFGGDKDLFEEFFATDEFRGGHWSVTEVVGAYSKFLFIPGSRTTPFIRGGLFLGIPKAHWEQSFEEQRFSKKFDAALGLDAAVGLVHMLSSQVGLGVEARFAHLAANEKDSVVPVERLTVPAAVNGPMGVRDPGGNLNWLDATAYVVYGF